MDGNTDTYESLFGAIDYSSSDSGSLMVVRDEFGRLPYELHSELSLCRRSYANMVLSANDLKFYSPVPHVAAHYRSLGFEVLDTPPIPVVLFANRPFATDVLRLLASFSRVIFVEVFYLDGESFVGTLDSLLFAKGTSWIWPQSECLFRRFLTEYGIFCSSSFDKSAPSSVQSFQLKKHVRVFFEAKGPERHDVRTYIGHGSPTPFVVDHDGVSFNSFSETDYIPVEIPLYVKHLWLCHKYPSVHQRLSEADFYRRDGESYSIWGFPLHKEQLSLLSQQLKSDRLIFPGDGCGAGLSSSPDRAVSGDPFLNDLTLEGVVQESAHETIKRGFAMSGTKTVIFSYCQQFVSDEVLRFALRSKHPVVFLEASNACVKRCASLGFVLSVEGPCLFSYRLSHPIFVPVTDRVPDTGTILYSENLLQHSFQIRSWSSICDYVWGMRPLSSISYSKDFQGKKKLPLRGSPSHFLALSFDDLEYGLRQSLPVYFYPVGKVVEDIISVSNVTSGSFRSRHPYKSFDRLFNLWVSKQKGILTHFRDDVCYFCFSQDTSSLYEWDEKCSLSAWRRRISFVNSPEHDKTLFFSDRPGEITFWIRGSCCVFDISGDLGEFLSKIGCPHIASEVLPLVVSLRSGEKTALLKN